MESNCITSKGSKLVVCARVGGANTTPLFSAAHFAKRNTKFGGGESEGGAGIHFPPTPFSARPARAVWFLPRRRRGISRDFVQKRFAPRSVIATIIDFRVFERKRSARSPRQRRGSLRIFPYISGLNQRAGEARKGFFYPAGGGSWWRSHQSKNNIYDFIRIVFALQFFPFLAFGKNTKQVFNPALFPPKAEWPKATY